MCDYVPYAKYLAYWRFFFGIQQKTTNKLVAAQYGIPEDIVIENIENAREQAIRYLFSKPQFKEQLKQIFIKFCSRTTTFKKIDKILELNFVKSDFIPLLKKYKPDKNSLGLRVMHIIESDLFFKMPMNDQGQNMVIKKLIKASTSYIVELEKLQKEYMSTYGITI